MKRPPVRRALEGAERPAARAGPGPAFSVCGGQGRALAVLGEELHHVVEAEAAVAPLADAIERQLATVTKALHRVDVQVEHLGDFGRGEHRSEFVYGHGPHVASLRALGDEFAPLGWPGVGCGSLMGGMLGWAEGVAKPYFGIVASTQSAQ